jgi:hypothetical protein
MNDDKYNRITRLIKQTGQLVVELELDELHTHQKIEQLNALVHELECVRAHYEEEQYKLWQESAKEKAALPPLECDAA